MQAKACTTNGFSQGKKRLSCSLAAVAQGRYFVMDGGVLDTHPTVLLFYAPSYAPRFLIVPRTRCAP